MVGRTGTGTDITCAQLTKSMWVSLTSVDATLVYTTGEGEGLLQRGGCRGELEERGHIKRRDLNGVEVASIEDVERRAKLKEIIYFRFLPCRRTTACISRVFIDESRSRHGRHGRCFLIKLSPSLPPLPNTSHCTMCTTSCATTNTADQVEYVSKQAPPVSVAGGGVGKRRGGEEEETRVLKANAANDDDDDKEKEEEEEGLSAHALR